MEINFQAIHHHVMSRLSRELPDKLYYHGIHHTRDDVLPAAMRLGEAAGLNNEDFLLLQTAALYHDVGYVETYAEHEMAGARIASEELPELGYHPDQVQLVVNMIMATRMPQSPSTLLEGLMCDADLDSLGRPDFFVTSHRLRLELMDRGLSVHVREWYERQLGFLSGHTYHTDVAEMLRQEGKQKNIQELRMLLNAVAAH